MIYEWDPKKAQTNVRDHGVAFEEPATVFRDPLAVTYSDPDHSDDEDSEITIGYYPARRLPFVSHCERRGRTRIISAREAARRERKEHEEDIGELEGRTAARV